jgi:hypothetical protein
MIQSSWLAAAISMNNPIGDIVDVIIIFILKEGLHTRANLWVIYRSGL